VRRSLILVAALAIVSCQGSPSGSSAEIDLTEFEIHPSLSSFDAGSVALDVVNEGEYGHTLVITDAGGHVLLAGEVIEAGESSTMSIDLVPGDYYFTCRIVAQDDEGNVIDHYEMGMSAEVTVRAG
jgi:plastocyanin